MLVAEQLTKRYGSKTALQEATFTLEKGITGLLGPNGAGKTTLLRILATYHKASGGRLLLNGVEWTSANMEKLRSDIGYLPQHIGLFPSLTVREYLDYIASMRGMNSSSINKRMNEVLREVNLEEVGREKVRSLSGGMKQRLGIAQAIIHEPALLLVDEPTAGLDPEERIRFRNLIKRLGHSRAVLLSTHITEDVSVTCDRVLLMNKGWLQSHDHVREVVAYAEGSVWGLQTEQGKYEQLRSDPSVFITDLKEQQEGLYHIRAVAASKPSEDAQPLQPTLEEGYMVWLNRK